MEDIINSKGSKWHGYYVQANEKSAMAFDKFFVDNGIVQGMGTDIVGKFEIEGTVENGVVQFNKQYIGQHNVTYSGVFDGRTIRGQWQIAEYNMSDDFTIWRADVAPWKGFFYEDSEQHLMILELSVQDGIMSGSGEDYKGKFVINGTIEKDIVLIKKENMNGESADSYKGKMIKQGLVRGTYETPSGPGMFTLQRCEPAQFEKDFAKIDVAENNDEDDYQQENSNEYGDDYGDQQNNDQEEDQEEEEQQ